MEEATYPGQRNTEKLDDFINFRLSKADRIKLEVVASERSLVSTLHELIDEAYNGVTHAGSDLARLWEKKVKIEFGKWSKKALK